MSNTDVASAITHPIPLAALALIVVSGVLSALIQKNTKPSSQLIRSIALYGFVAAVILGLAAIAADTFGPYFQSDIRVSGVVVDESGEPIDLADISVDGGPSLEADSNGKFDFSLERSRFGSGYTISASDSKYVPRSLKIEHDLTTPIRIVLVRKPFKSDVIDDVTNTIVGHWVGLPWVSAVINLRNSNDYSIDVASITASTKSPAGVVTKLGNINVTGIVPPQTGTAMRIRRNGSVQIAGYYFMPNPDFNGFSARVNTEVVAHPPDMNPLSDVPRISEALAADLKAYADHALFWSEGRWELTLCARVDDQDGCRVYGFNLSAENIAHLRKITEEYRSGVGVLNGLQFGPVNSFKGLVNVSLGE